MQKLISYFFSDFNLKSRAAWFKRLLYVLLIIKCVYWLCFYPLLFGVNSLFLAKPYPMHAPGDLAFFLYAQSSPCISSYFIISVLALCILQLSKYRIYLLIDLVIWFLIVNLHNRIYSSLTAGDYLLNQFLLLGAFLRSTDRPGPKLSHPVKIVLHNLALVAIMVQVCLAYFLSGAFKLLDHSWLTGSAVGTIAQLKHFSMFSFPGSAPPGIFSALNYGVLLYQCSFPLVVWVKTLKKPLLITGIAMHLYIALVMGLVEFGCIMLLPYLFFWPLAEQEHLA